MKTNLDIPINVTIFVGNDSIFFNKTNNNKMLILL